MTNQTTKEKIKKIEIKHNDCGNKVFLDEDAVNQLLELIEEEKKKSYLQAIKDFSIELASTKK